MNTIPKFHVFWDSLYLIQLYNCTRLAVVCILPQWISCILLSYRKQEPPCLYCFKFKSSDLTKHTNRYFSRGRIMLLSSTPSTHMLTTLKVIISHTQCVFIVYIYMYHYQITYFTYLQSKPQSIYAYCILIY